MKTPQNLSSLTEMCDNGGRGAEEIVQQKFRKGGGVSKVFVIADLALSAQLTYDHSS